MFTFSDVWYQLINNILYESTDTEQQEHSILLCQWIIKATSILGILYSCINYIRLFQTMHIAISSKLASLFCFMFLVYILDNKPSGKLSIYYPSLATFIGLSLSWSTQILLLCLGAKILSPYSSLSTVVIIIIMEKAWNSAINLYIHILDIKKNNLRVLMWPKLMVLSELMSIICFYYVTQKRKNVSLSRVRSF
ncbi:uncharacterized protein LOC126904436 [Daktulosphaira vitifoliae]|uniref:uncharacterized protein LOC126904436 n=1 Tax=Daktulosphaira vitifoliae TaxID=58002 RepID=UPI0021AAEFA3|nr:uncharacterized protein LOC126904436 [Daktulosphaira vitifoliae]